MDIRALIFDVNSTLIDIETDEAMEEAYRTISHFLTYLGIMLHRWEVRDLYMLILKEDLARSTERYPEFDAVEVWRQFIRRSGSSVTRALPEDRLQQLPRFLAELFRGATRKRLTTYPQVLETLDRLKPLYPMAVVTDAQSAYAVPELRAVGLMDYFYPVIVSGDYGYRKPDPRLFGLALTMLAIDGEHAVYVGDQRFRDVFGARQLGMKTVLYFTGPLSAKNPEIELDYVIHRFGDLPVALEFLQMH
jgi:putative hydrolase of the HAD superfamily